MEYVRVGSVNGYEVKGELYLLHMLKVFLRGLEVCGIEGFMEIEDIKDWITKLDKNYKKGQK